MGKGTQSIKTQMEKLFEFGQGIKEHFAPTDPKQVPSPASIAVAAAGKLFG